MEYALLLPVLVLSLAFAVSVLIYSIEKVAGRRISVLRRKGTHPTVSAERSPRRPSSSGDFSLLGQTGMPCLDHRYRGNRVPLVGPPSILIIFIWGTCKNECFRCRMMYGILSVVFWLSLEADSATFGPLYLSKLAMCHYCGRMPRGSGHRQVTRGSHTSTGSPFIEECVGGQLSMVRDRGDSARQDHWQAQAPPAGLRWHCSARRPSGSHWPLRYSSHPTSIVPSMFSVAVGFACPTTALRPSLLPAHRFEAPAVILLSLSLGMPS